MDLSKKLDKGGYGWFALYSLLYAYITNWNLFLAKLDADTADTTLETDYGITSPTIGSTYGKDIRPNADPQGKVVDLLTAMRNNFNDAVDAIAGDDGIAGTVVFTAEKFTTSEHLMNTYGSRVKDLGFFEDEIVLFLDQLIPKFNRVLAYCDADATLTDTDYASLYAIGEFVWPSSSSSSSSSCLSSSSSSSSRSSSSSSCRSSSSSSSRSSSSSSSSSRSSSSSSRSSSSSSSSCLSSSSSSSSRSSSSSSSSCLSSSSSSSSRSSSSSSSSSRSSSSSSSSCRSSSSSSSSRSSSSSSSRSSSSSSSKSSSSSSSSSSCRSSSSSSSSSQAIA